MCKKISALILVLIICFGLIATGCSQVGTAQTQSIIMYVVGEETADTKKVLEEMNKYIIPETGAELVLKFATWENYDLTISSGEEYDLIVSADWLNYWENVDKGAFAEIIDEDIQENAPDLWEDREYYLDVKVDGKRYAIPAYVAQAANRMLAFRGDLMQEYGIEEITSLADIENYLSHVKENEPDMIPFDFQGTSPWILLSMYATDIGWSAVGTNSFGQHAYYDLNDPNHEVFIAVEQPEMKEYTEMMKRWYDNGYFSKSVLSNETDSKLSFQNGKSAMAYMSSPEDCDAMYRTLNEDERSEWDVYFAPLAQESQRIYGQMNIAASVSAFTEKKDLALKVLNELYSNEDVYKLLRNGLEGVHYEVMDGDIKKVLDSTSYLEFASGLNNDEFNFGIETVLPQYDELKAHAKSTEVYDPYMNIYMNTESVREISLALDEVFSTMTAPRLYGVIEDVDVALQEELDALKKAGIDDYVAFLNEQLDIYQEENGL